MKSQRLDSTINYEHFTSTTQNLLTLLDEIYVPQDEQAPQPRTMETLTTVETFMQELHSFDEIPTGLLECVYSIRSAVFRALFPLFNKRRLREFYHFLVDEPDLLSTRSFFSLIEACNRILKMDYSPHDLIYYQTVVNDLENKSLTQVLIDFYLCLEGSLAAKKPEYFQIILDILTQDQNYDYDTLEFVLIVFRTHLCENINQHKILPHLVTLLHRMINIPPPETFSCTLFTVISMYTSRKQPHLDFLKETRNSVVQLLISEVITGRPLHALVILVIDTLPTLMSQQFVDYLTKTGLFLFVLEKSQLHHVIYRKLLVSILRYLENLHGHQYKRLLDYINDLPEREGYEDQIIAITSQSGTTEQHLRYRMTPSKL